MYKQIINGLWAALKPALPWILIAVLGASVAYCAPVVGTKAQIERLKARIQSGSDLSERQGAEISNLKASLALARTERNRDALASSAAITEERASCAARIEQARKSSAKITELFREDPAHEKLDCPSRRLIDPDRLHDAITGPPA